MKRTFHQRLTDTSTSSPFVYNMHKWPNHMWSLPFATSISIPRGKYATQWLCFHIFREERGL